MVAAIPLIGAAAGGLIGSAFGYGSIGMSIGWLVGSAFMPRPKTKIQFNDPGAQELQSFNTAVRGLVIPVLFGTNRVNSQIVWQNDFRTSKTYKAVPQQSSGKGGGSSGSSKKQKPSAYDVIYDYSIDMVFHLGMCFQPSELIRGWANGKRIESDILNNVGIGGVFTADNGETVRIDYTSAAYSNGSWPGETLLPFSTSDINALVYWPLTAWVAFDQLKLGNSPSIPQLTWEIGPVNSDVDPPTSGVFVTNESNYVAGQNLVGMGVTNTGWGFYMDQYANWEGIHTDGRTFRYNNATINQAISQSLSNIATQVSSALNQNSTGFNIITGIGATHNGKYVVIAGYNDGVSELIHYFKILSTGSLYHHATVGVECYLTESKNQFMTGGAGTDNDCIYSAAAKISDGKFYIKKLPSPNDARALSFTLPNSYVANSLPSFLNVSARIPGIYYYLPEMLYAGLVVSEYNVYTQLSGIVVSNYDPIEGAFNDEFFYYVPKTLQNSNAFQTPFVNSFNAYYGAPGQQGYWASAMLGNPRNFSQNLTSSGGSSIIIQTSVENAGGRFLSRDGLAAAYPMPSISSWANSDFSNVIATQDVESGVFAGAKVIMMTQHGFNSKALGEIDDAILTYFVYNPLDGNFYGGDKVRTNLWYTNSINANPVGYPYTGQFISQPRYFPATNNIYLHTICGPQAGRYTAAKTDMQIWAEVSYLLPTGEDLTPPEIIREILCNPYFGIGYSYADVEATSYGLAVAYCQTQDFYVSTKYQNAQAALTLVEQLLAIYDGYMTINGDGKIKFGKYEWTADSVRVIDNHHLLVKTPGEPPVNVTRGALQDTVNLVKVNYIDRSLDYKNNMVEEADEVDQDLHGVRVREFPPQFVMSQATARKVALRSLLKNLYKRDAYEFKLSWKDADLEPGDVITLVDSYSSINTQARIVKWQEKERGVFEIGAIQELQYVQNAEINSASITVSSPYDPVTSFGTIYPPTVQGMWEMANDFNNNGTTLRVYAGYYVDGRPAGALLYISQDGTTYAPITDAQPYLTGGIICQDLPNNTDVVNNMEVLLHPNLRTSSESDVWFTETLADADASVRAAGGTMFRVASEILAYETVTLVSENRYRFARTYRNWPGDSTLQAHSSGDIFYMLGAGMLIADLDASRVGTTFYYKIVPYDINGLLIDISSVEAQTYTITGAGLKPAPPAYPFLVVSGEAMRGITKTYVNSANPVEVSWQDTDKITGYGKFGFGINGYGDFTTPSPATQWLVNVYGSGSNLVHSTVVSTTYFTYLTSANVAQNGAWCGNLAFTLKTKNAYGYSPFTSVVSLELFR